MTDCAKDPTVERIKELVLAAMKYVDAEAAWEGNPSRFLQDHKAAAEKARVSREELKAAVRVYRQALSEKKIQQQMGK